MRNFRSAVHYYVVENGELKHLHTTDTDGDFSKHAEAVTSTPRLRLRRERGDWCYARALNSK